MNGQVTIDVEGEGFWDESMLRNAFAMMLEQCYMKHRLRARRIEASMGPPSPRAPACKELEQRT